MFPRTAAASVPAKTRPTSRAGRIDITPQRVDMAAAVSHTLADELSQGVTGRELAFKIGDLPDACGDRAMLQRVWANLFDNAIKFTASKPNACIEVGARAGEEETVYFVRDNGVGFDAQHAGRLFGVLERLHGGRSPRTGTGLAIVKRIVARHGGRVWAEGKLGEGATFHFALPAPRARVGSGTARAGGGMRVADVS